MHEHTGHFDEMGNSQSPMRTNKHYGPLNCIYIYTVYAIVAVTCYNKLSDEMHQN